MRRGLPPGTACGTVRSGGRPGPEPAISSRGPRGTITST